MAYYQKKTIEDMYIVLDKCYFFYLLLYMFVFQYVYITVNMNISFNL